MARQQFTVDPSVKEFEVYTDFAGGQNSEVSNEKLKDNEFPILQNVDLSGRGSARNRSGRVSIVTLPGPIMGGFFFYRVGQPTPDKIVASGGKLYVANDDGTYSQIAITDGGSAFTFQTSRPIEGVMFQDKAYVATGTKLVEVSYASGWSAVTVTPYTPSVYEAIYIGTNGLADNPDSYIADGTGTLAAIGIKPQWQTGAVSKAETFTAYIDKPNAGDGTDFKWEYKKASDSTWTQAQDFTAEANQISLTFDTATAYDIRVTIRKTGTTTPTPEYTLTGYQVNVTDINVTYNTSGIQTCNRILLHWERLILYGDNTNPSYVFVSDLQNPGYFPVPATIDFDTGRLEEVSAMIRYQSMLVVFSKTTIQTLVGKSPEDFERYTIHEGLGCDAGYTPQVVGNNIIFKATEGVYILKPNPYRLETLNVQPIDLQVRSELPVSSNACALVYDNQYWLCFPDSAKMYRYYYTMGVWVTDASSKLNISRFLSYGGDVYELTQNGSIYKQDKTVYTDDGQSYDMIVDSKYYDLSATFHNKKLKRIYVLAGSEVTAEYFVTVYADAATVLTPDSGSVSIDANGYTTWTTTTDPNMIFDAGTIFGSWVWGQSAFGTTKIAVNRATIRGKCRRVRVTFKHSDPSFCELFGFGFEFKMKRP